MISDSVIGFLLTSISSNFREFFLCPACLIIEFQIQVSMLPARSIRGDMNSAMVFDNGNRKQIPETAVNNTHIFKSQR